jgi:DNA-binding MarR family transcriptional regulator
MSGGIAVGFNLRDLPTHEALEAFVSRYPGIDVDAIEAFLLLIRASYNTTTTFDVCFSHYGLSEGRFGVMMLLRTSSDGMLAPSELADRLNVTRGTITGLLDGLERAGLVVRQAHTEDRRMLTICLTQQGRELLERVVPEHFQRIMQAMSVLSHEERTQLVGMLRKIDGAVRSLQ